MHKPEFFQHISIELPEKAIFRRLGFRRDKTVIPPDQADQINGYIQDAMDLIRLRGAARCLDITARDASGLTLADGTRFSSASLAAMLKDASRVLVMGTTAGNAIMEEIRLNTGGQDMTRGIVLDAVASEMVDESLSWIMHYYATRLRRENRALTSRRFSAGYSDFDLRHQADFYRLLELSRLEVELTASCMLLPEKSVTAVAGIIEGA